MGRSGRAAITENLPYGEYFLRLDDVPEAISAAGSFAAQDPVAFQAQMEALELAGGPYNDALAEPLGSLGRYYRQQGQYPQALAAYRRAVHVVRINEGLYSDRQVPLLRELLATFRDAGDYETLDDRYEYLFRLFGSGQPPHTDLRLNAALEYLRWQREALRMDLKSNGPDRLQEAIDLNDEMLESMAAAEAVPYRWRREFVFNQLRNLYILRDRFQPATHEEGLGNSRDIFGAQPIALDLQERQLENLARSAPTKARELVDGLRGAAAAAGPLEEAQLELSLADWNFWNGQRGRAGEGYARVAGLLADADEPALLQAWLGQPAELPEDGAFWVGRRRAQAGVAEVRASFDVSNRGRVSNVQVEALNPEAEAELARFKRRLAKTLFRPRWDNGEAQAVQGVVREYQLLR